MNPYSFEGPVTNPNMFYGYQQDSGTIVRRVTAPGNTRLSCAVVGGPRMGKTTLLRQVERRLLSGDYNRQIVIPLYLNMAQMESLEVFLSQVADMLSSYLTYISHAFSFASQVATLLQSVKTSREPLPAFIEALHEMVQAAQEAVPPLGLRVVLLIDDLHLMPPQAISILSSSLRSLHMELLVEQAVAYVISGSRRSFMDAPDSPLENLLVYQSLHVFDEEQALALINEPTGGRIPPAVAQRVYSETGGHPFLLQYLMSTLCEHEDWTNLAVRDVEQAIESFHEEGKDFEEWWKKLSKADRVIYKVFCEAGWASVESLRRMKLNMPAEDGGGLVSVSMIRESLRVLGTMGLIRGEEKDSKDDSPLKLAGQWPARQFRRMNGGEEK